jgi:riboflavin synthase
MFTGIVEDVGVVVEISTAGTNRDLVFRSRLAAELRVDQSVSHNGVCLTVVETLNQADVRSTYRVTAVQETLQRSNIGSLNVGDGVNLERSLRMGDRLDGHLVQGHVDTVTTCSSVEERGGSWWFTFSLPEQKHLLVAKGSICLNGTSLTIAALTATTFSVAVIPYTFENTTFNTLRAGSTVNVEFDVLGKYVERMLLLQRS